jgi:cellulose synthase/poly-beta-1,6-N-acetylglucosamine synthase-like glycosyltransferase
VIVVLVFAAAAAVVLYAYLGYPALIALLARLRPAPAPRRSPEEPAVTLLLVVHDEERWLAEKIRNLLDLDYPPGKREVLVVSDGSRDGSERIAASFAGEGVRLVALPGPRGKAAALGEAVPQATGEILVLTDARQRLAPDAVRELAAYFADPSVGAVSGELMLEDGGPGPAAGLGRYWRYEKLIRRAESRFDSTVGATGALYAVRRSLWPALDPRTILDDVAVPMEVVLAGRRVLFAPEARAYDRLSDDAAHEYRRKVRTLAGSYQLALLRPALLDPFRNRVAWQFWSHKLARLAVPWCLAVLLAASAALAARGGVFYGAVLGLQLIIYLMAAAGALAARAGLRVPLASVPYAFALANLAAAHAFFGFLRGTAGPAWKAPR